ncbi:MAG: patatin-like phospholipase family protein [bacterium]|nr:patatin-like phospholipase family protein [Myxococcales bacterium]
MPGPVILLESAIGAPLSELTDLLAQALAVEYGDKVAVVDIAPEGPIAWRATPEGRSPLSVDVAVIGGADPLEPLLARLAHDFHYVFLDPRRSDPAFVARIAEQVDRVVYFTYDTFGALPAAVRPGATVLAVALLDPPDAPYNRRLYRAGTCRLRVPPAHFTGRRLYTELAAADRGALSRVARALSGRTVGLALGGGGAWGYAHIALIESLIAEGLPIDLVAGVSFGSLCGAFFASDGLAGLEMLVSDCTQLAVSVWASTISTSALDAFVRRRLNETWLEALEVPFLPVATNVGTGEAEVIRMGRIGLGVRASSSLPGLLSPTIVGGVRYVDGGISANIPASMLPSEGAHFIIASNVLQHPGFTRVRTGGNRVFRAVFELDPVARAKDLILSITTLTRQGGELMSVCAHVTYQAKLTGVAPWDFMRGPQIVEQARRDVAPTIDRIRQAWGTLARPGGGS